MLQAKSAHSPMTSICVHISLFVYTAGTHRLSGLPKKCKERHTSLFQICATATILQKGGGHTELISKGRYCCIPFISLWEWGKKILASYQRQQHPWIQRLHRINGKAAAAASPVLLWYIMRHEQALPRATANHPNYQCCFTPASKHTSGYMTPGNIWVTFIGLHFDNWSQMALKKKWNFCLLPCVASLSLLSPAIDCLACSGRFHT